MNIVSFCIPTFNRARKLEKTLLSIIRSINESRKISCINFEIVISDNCSNDNTLEVVNKMAEEYSSDIITINYFRNKSNIGASKNLTNLPNLATGEYVWFFSDDDYMTESAVSNFLKVHKKNFSFIYTARLLADSDLNIINPNPQPCLKKLGPEFKNGNEMISKLGVDIMGILGFFSSIMIKRELWVRQQLSFSDTTEFGYLKIILSGIKSETCFIIREPGVLCRLDYRGFNGNDIFVWLDNYIDAFKFANEIGYNKEKCKEMAKRIIKTSSRSFCVSKALGIRGGNLFQFKKSELWYDEKYFNYWFLISLFPSSLLNRPYRIVVYLRSKFLKI